MPSAKTCEATRQQGSKATLDALVSALIHWFLPASGRDDIIPLIVRLLAKTLQIFTITHLTATLFVTFFTNIKAYYLPSYLTSKLGCQRLIKQPYNPTPLTCDIMADDASAAESAPITFSVKASNDAKYTFTLPDSTTVLDLKEKLSSPEHADTPAERQRLIYSGRVLKDNETLASYKIKDGHTIHLVKSAASNQRQNPPPQPASTAAGTTPSSVPGVPTNIAAGTGNNPLAGLTGARYAGFAQLPGAGMFGPDGGVSSVKKCTNIIH